MKKEFTLNGSRNTPAIHFDTTDVSIYPKYHLHPFGRLILSMDSPMTTSLAHGMSGMLETVGHALSVLAKFTIMDYKNPPFDHQTLIL